MQFDFQYQSSTFDSYSCHIFLEFLRRMPQFLPKLRLTAHISEGTLRADTFAFIFVCGLHYCTSQPQVRLYKKLKCFLAKKSGHVCPLCVDVTAGLDTNGVQLAFKDPPDTVDFADRESAHKRHDCSAVVRNAELTVRLVLV